MAGKGRIENLRPPWKPGESGNPDGRPKKWPISDRYSFLVEMPLPKKLRLELGLWKGATHADAVAKRQIDAAIAGDCRAAREVREAIERRPHEPSETIQFPTRDMKVIFDKLFGGRNELPTDASSVPNTSQDYGKDSK
jgi:hypothetical protein